jgi:transposase-like protein
MRPEISCGDTTLLWNIFREATMNVTAEERRRTLRLFNVSEAARQIGVPVPEMHRWISAGRLPMPQVRLGKRRYYTQEDIVLLTRRCAETENHP